MWNILLTLIIAAVIWFIGASAFNSKDSLKSVTPTPQSTKSAVKSLTQDTVDQVNRAKQLQKQEEVNEN